MENQVRIGRGDMYAVGGAVKLFEPQAVIASSNDEMTPASKNGLHDRLATSRFSCVRRRMQRFLVGFGDVAAALEWVLPAAADHYAEAEQVC
jgi:hypothetical protein